MINSHNEAIIMKEIAKSYIRQKSANYAIQNCNKLVMLTHGLCPLKTSHKRFALDVFEIGKYLFKLNMYRKSMKYFEAAYNMLKKLSKDLFSELDLAALSQSIGDCAIALKYFRKGIIHLRFCLHVFMKVSKDSSFDKLVADVCFELAKRYIGVDDASSAMGSFNNYLHVSSNLSINTDSSMAEIYSLLNNSCLKKHNYAQAAAYLKHLLEFKTTVKYHQMLQRTMNLPQCVVILVGTPSN